MSIFKRQPKATPTAYPERTAKSSPSGLFRQEAMERAEEALKSGHPERMETSYNELMALGPVPGSFGDLNSYGPGPCRHLAAYPGCPKCWRH